MATQATYVAADNSAGNAQVLGAASQDIYVKKVLFGSPADGKVTVFYNKRVTGGHASGMGSTPTANTAFRFTQATHAAGFPFVTFIDFTGTGNPGLRLDGGSFHTDAAQVTVLWEPVDEAD